MLFSLESQWRRKAQSSKHGRKESDPKSTTSKKSTFYDSINLYETTVEHNREEARRHWSMGEQQKWELEVELKKMRSISKQRSSSS